MNSKLYNLSNDVVSLILSFRFVKFTGLKSLYGKRMGECRLFFPSIQIHTRKFDQDRFKCIPWKQLCSIDLTRCKISDPSPLFQWVEKYKLNLIFYLTTSLIENLKIPTFSKWIFILDCTHTIQTAIPSNAKFELSYFILGEYDLNKIQENHEYLVKSKYNEQKIKNLVVNFESKNPVLTTTANSWKEWFGMIEKKVEFLSLSFFDFKHGNMYAVNELLKIGHHTKQMILEFTKNSKFLENVQEYIPYSKITDLRIPFPTTDKEWSILSSMNMVKDLTISMGGISMDCWKSEWDSHFCTSIHCIRICHASREFLISLVQHAKFQRHVHLIFIWMDSAPYIHPEVWLAAKEGCKNKISFQILANQKQ